VVSPFGLFFFFFLANLLPSLSSALSSSGLARPLNPVPNYQFIVPLSPPCSPLISTFLLPTSAPPSPFFHDLHSPSSSGQGRTRFFFGPKCCHGLHEYYPSMMRAADQTFFFRCPNFRDRRSSQVRLPVFSPIPLLGREEVHSCVPEPFFPRSPPSVLLSPRPPSDRLPPRF